MPSTASMRRAISANTVGHGSSRRSAVEPELVGGADVLDRAGGADRLEVQRRGPHGGLVAAPSQITGSGTAAAISCRISGERSVPPTSSMASVMAVHRSAGAVASRHGPRARGQGRRRHRREQGHRPRGHEALAAEGARVVAGARTTDALAGSTASRAVAVDLATPDGPARLVERAIDEHGRVDVLVNNVGAVRRPARRLPRHQRRGVRVVDAAELLRRAARHARGASPDMLERGARARSSTSPRSTRSSSPTAA